MKFGINTPKKLNGAKLYVAIFQISSMLPLIYIFAVSGYASLITERTALSILFDLGICSIPRLEALGISFFYKTAKSEVLVYFALLATALVYGIICNRLLNKEYKRAKFLRLIFIFLIVADLVIRVLPFGFNSTFELPFEIIGFAVRLACLAFVVLDLIFDKKQKKNKRLTGE